VKSEYVFYVDQLLRSHPYYYDSTVRYLISVQSQPVPDDDAAEGSTANHVKNISDTDEHPRSSGPSRRKLSKENKKLQRGSNKGRRFGKVRDELELCWRVAKGDTCEFGAE